MGVKRRLTTHQSILRYPIDSAKKAVKQRKTSWGGTSNEGLRGGEKASISVRPGHAGGIHGHLRSNHKEVSKRDGAEKSGKANPGWGRHFRFP